MPPDPGAAKATARAEQGTVRALGVPRVKVGSNPSVKSQAGLSAVIRPGTDCPVAGSTIDILVLPCASAPETTDTPQDEVDRLPALTSAKRQAHQELLREIDEVRTLHHQPLETKLPRSGFEKLRRKQADRVVRDARAIKVFEASVAEISEGMERRVLEASYRFRDGREEVKEALSTVQRELAMDSCLVVGDMAYVQDMWNKLEAQCNRRVYHRQDFQGELESVEILRSNAVGRELRRLIDGMVAIAYRMPGEIERIAEEHASELNGVLINNRLAYAELLAKMEKEDFAFALGVRRNWETRRDAWRCLRHGRALHVFHADLQAPNFTNPPERVALFRGFKRGQVVRHERRIAILLDLIGRRPVAEGEEGQGQSLTTEVVSTILEEYEALHKEEIAAILEAREGLEIIHNAKIEEARARREALKAELHDYGAFSAEPDWEPSCLQVEAFVNGVENEEFLRKAGGLKHELVTLIQGMRSPDIMYDFCLLEVMERIELLLCGVDLERILDKHGKAAFRRGLVDSVERLRKASKSDTQSILEVVRRQAADLAQIPEIDNLLASCLERSTEDIDKVVESIQRRGGGRLESRSGSERLSAGSKNSKRSGVGSKRSVSRERSEEKSANGSRGGVGSRSSGAQSLSGTSRGACESEIEIDTSQVRAVQRRLGMLASASDLSEGFKDELRGIRKALEQQRACNVAVDEVVQVETSGELDARFSEYSQLLDQTISSMDFRAQDLHACAARFCCFFAAVARELEAHDKREIVINNAAEERIFDHKEDFRLADEEREYIVKATIDRVRMAADERELEVSFAKVLGLLDEVEESYRVYHKTVFEACAIHPMEIAKEAERIRAAVCAHVGLRPPLKEEITSIHTGTDEKGGSSNNSGHGEEVETDNPSAEVFAANDKNTGEETPIEEAPAEGELTKVENYRAPSGNGAEYVIERTPDKILQELLVQNTEDENAEDENDSPTDDDGDGAIDQTEEVRELKRKAAGEATAGDVSAAADLPSYWRGTFVPLSREQVEALKVERGQEAVTEYLEKRGRRFRELSKEEQERLRIAAEAESVARSKTKKDAAKAKSKLGKKDGTKSKKSPKGAAASAAAAKAPPSTSDVGEQEIDPPSVLEVYESVKREMEEYRAFRKEEIARNHAQKRLIPRDPEGEPIMEEISVPGEDAASMLRSLRDDLISRIECKTAAREASVGVACAVAQEMLTEELEERLRKHWPRKGRAEVGSRKPRDGELHAHRQKAHRFIRNIRDKLANQEKAFQEALDKSSSACKNFRQTVASMVEGLAEAVSIAALQGIDSRCNNFVAAFEAEHQALQPKLERFVEDEPARLLRSCDDVTRLCKTFAEGGDYDSLELKELEELLKEPRQEISRAAEARRAALVEAVEAHGIALKDEKVFKKEQTRCIMELSLREGLGQRYGTPRRNAHERLRSLIMRDNQCAETIQRLLDDLERLTVSRGDVIVDGMSITEHFQRASMASGENGATDPHAEDPRGGTNRRIAGAISSPVTPAYGRSGTQLLRCSLISLREALFRHASFLEFLPAPERVDRKRPVPGRSIEEPIDEECRHEMEEEIDPEVMLMPHDGETFAGSLDSLEGRCRSETRDLYKSEGKDELLGEGGVPESLRTWLQQSRERALGEGGHQQRAQRRLREQVERFEFLIAKRPVPRNSTLEPRAPVLMLLDTSNRLEKEGSARRTKLEALFEKSITVWDATRTKHIRLLRPALGSDDCRHELDELLAAEAKRTAEVTSAITEFRRELIEQEAAGVRDRARKVAGCYKGVAAILDSVIMGDDLGKLPGDEDQEIKRKGLRRLRKADRGFLRQEKHEQQSPITKPTKEGHKKPATKTERDLVIGKDGATTSRDGTDKDPSSQNEGRQWHRRKWRTSGLSGLTRVVLAAATAASAEGPSVDFIAILKSTTIDIIAPEQDSDPSALLTGEAGSSKRGAKGKAVKKERKAVPKEATKKERKVVPKKVVNEEPPEVVEARKRAEEQKAEVRAWEQELRGAFEEEIFVTTAHRALVAARDAFVTELTEKAENIVVELLERYGRMLEAELMWRTKWKQLYTDLIKSAEAS